MTTQKKQKKCEMGVKRNKSFSSAKLCESEKISKMILE